VLECISHSLWFKAIPNEPRVNRGRFNPHSKNPLAGGSMEKRKESPFDRKLIDEKSANLHVDPETKVP